MSKKEKIKVVDSKDIKCPCCQSRDFKLQKATDGFGFLACLSCGKLYEVEGYYVDIEVISEQ